MTQRCALYVRLSKEDEDKPRAESESIQNQKALLRRYAAEHGWEIHAVYADEDRSGADGQRPGFLRMLEEARQRKFQIILCKSQSRFTRDMELVERYIHGLFPQWGIRFIAVADNADTQDRGNKKSRQINGLVNEWYLEDLSENVRMVFDLKRREGKYIGGAPLFGYRKDPADKNHLLIDPTAAAVVRQIFQWALEGQGRQAIALRLNRQGVPSPARYKALHGGPAAQSLWSRVTVGRILTNEMYLGVMVQGRRKKVSYKSKAVIDLPREQWYRVEHTHEAIIPQEVFQAVQHRLSRRSRSDGTGRPHPLAGLVRCAACGSAMSKTSNGSRSYLRCSRYAAGGDCTRHSVRLDRLEELILERIRYYCQKYYVLDSLQLPAPPNALREALEQERKDLIVQLAKRTQALKTLYLDRAEGILPQAQFAELSRLFASEQSHLKARLEQVGAELERCSASAPPPDQPQRFQALLELETLPRPLAVGLIEQIEVGEQDPKTGEQEIAVTWKF